MPYAAAISQHPVTALAVGEVTGEVLDRLGTGVDVAFVFVTPHHIGALEDVASAVRTLIAPHVLVGCAAAAVAGSGVEAENGSGVALWAGRVGGAALPVRLDTPGGFDELALRGWPDRQPFEPGSLVLLGDAHSFPAAAAIARLQDRHPGLVVHGGTTEAAPGSGGNRLALDNAIHTDGAVGVLFGREVSIDSIVSQGYRPLGDPLVVTRAERAVIYEMAGRPPVERLEELARGRLDEDDVRLVNEALYLGVVVDEHKGQFGPGDFLVRRVIGADRSTGAIAVAEAVHVGTTVQFHVRDAASADAEMRSLLSGIDDSAGGALLFTGGRRGRRLFGESNHDAGLLADAIDGAPSAGIFATDQFGPIGGRNALHSSAASIAVFSDR